MNPLTNVKNITKLNEIELAKGTKKSWHDIYKDSAWIFIGGLSFGLTEGDILAVFSQCGEIVNLNMVRDKKTGKTKGYCFLCYANQKSTILAVDNFNGIKLCNRTIRVDHVQNYKPPKEDERDDEITKKLKSEGCAPRPFMQDEESFGDVEHKKEKKKKAKKEKKKKRHHSNCSDGEDNSKHVSIKKEKHDPGYDKYDASSSNKSSLKEHLQNSSKKISKSKITSENVSRSESEEDGQSNGEQKQTKHKSKYIKKSVEKEKSQDSLAHRHKHKKQKKEKKHFDKRKRSQSTSSDSSTSSSSRGRYEHQTKNCDYKNLSKKRKQSSVSSSSSEDENNSPKESKSKRFECSKESFSRSKHSEKVVQQKYRPDSSLSKRNKHSDSQSFERSSSHKH